jgi:hypothetical protein
MNRLLLIEHKEFVILWEEKITNFDGHALLEFQLIVGKDDRKHEGVSRMLIDEYYTIYKCIGHNTKKMLLQPIYPNKMFFW